ncbi:MAG: aminotransferase class I/II-fold pyridoxal phosphate-dependent enzyme [Clostridiales bacterium]|nr:aminotransferase class I/II-fold pyridoxal phosphate-dependent enzyme [Clostridiales bacterium]
MESRKTELTKRLYESLAGYGAGDFYPYHMPGHKRSQNCGAMSDFFRIDITEIDGFDNLHQAEGIIRQAQGRAAKLYGAEETFFLINGSTCGVLAAISAVADRNDMLLIARNCHKSVYNAAFLKELNLRYIYPKQIEEYDIFDAVSPRKVEEALECYPECKAVVITSPTYEGIVSDIEAISRIVHAKGKILIVDEAHGAHFGMAQDIPENAVRQGADIVIHSLHKTLPSMTQTAILHVNGTLVNRARLRRYLSIYQSSSPSYVLMASMDSCISYMSENAEEYFAKFYQNYQNFLNYMEKCSHIRIGQIKDLDKNKYNFCGWDICKLVISVKGTSITGQDLYDMLLKEFHLQMEMAARSYVLAIMTIADEEEGWKRLASALLQIDGRIEERTENKTDDKAEGTLLYPTVNMTLAQALESDSMEIPLKQSKGKIAAGFINLYPPGIPILVPGEVLNDYVLEQIQESMDAGLNVQGVSENGMVSIIK